MADTPQLADGYTMIANKILEELAKIRVPGQANQVLWVVFRKTYGFHKKEDRISLSQLSTSTNMKQPHVARAVKVLLKMCLVTKKGNDRAVTYGFQKDYTKWKPLPKKVTLPKKVMIVTNKGNESLPKKVHTKDIKETIQKKKKCAPKNPAHQTCVDYFCEQYQKHRKVKYAFQAGKDGRLIKTLLKNWNQEQLRLIIDQLFRTKDQFIASTARDVSILSHQQNKLVQEAKEYHIAVERGKANKARYDAQLRETQEIIRPNEGKTVDDPAKIREIIQNAVKPMPQGSGGK